MASPSLRELLTQERFEFRAPTAPGRPTTPRTPLVDGRAFSSRQPSPARAPDEERPPRGVKDEAAARTVVSILSGYAGRFLKDAGFRRSLREKCAGCLAPAARQDAGHAVLANLELGIESIERLAKEGATPRDTKIRSLQNSIRLLSIVASLNVLPSNGAAAGDGIEGYTCAVPNSHISACAQLYLSVVYKIERNDPVSARHLLQVFADAPSLARKNLLPDLWDHLFLPHLLHLKVWYSKEAELVAGWDAEDQDRRMKSLHRAYNDQMNAGTAQFALYYKEWLKAGADAPPVPTVPLPSTAGNTERTWERQSVTLSRSSVNRSLYHAVFGPALHQDGAEDQKPIAEIELNVERGLELDDDSAGSFKTGKLSHSNLGLQDKQSDVAKGGSIPEIAQAPRRSYSFRLFSCRGDLSRNVIHHPKASKQETVPTEKELDRNEPTITLERAVAVVTNSDSLRHCEYAVHAVARACSDSHRNPNLEILLSSSSFIQGLLEVTFTSKDDDVLESAISVLAELVARNEVNRQVVLNADPQLEVFLRLLRSGSLFLKAAVVLYLMKPKAKQMLSLDWIPLVLHVLECGDEIQAVSSVKCSPKAAAFYLLDQLLMGFDVDRNVENAKQMVALGGLDLLMTGLEIGGAQERKGCISLLTTCIQADGSCRNYLADNLKKEPVFRFLLGSHQKSSGAALHLMSELICLNRTTQIVKFLKELKNDGSLNTMHILLVYLQQAPLVQRPMAAAILLQLDLLADPLQYSVYREEAVDVIIASLEHNSHSKRVQEQSARALSLLAGRFSRSGESIAEAWLLKRAGLDDSLSDSFRRTEILKDKGVRAEEEKLVEERLKKLALILLNSGKKRFLMAMSNCIADGIPSLARSCLITISWMSCSLSPLHGCNTFQPLACSILAPRLLESLSYDRALEERVLASVSLLNLVRHPECLERLFPLNKDTIESLQDLAEVTWTAKELLFACCR